MDEDLKVKVEQFLRSFFESSSSHDPRVHSIVYESSEPLGGILHNTLHSSLNFFGIGVFDHMAQYKVVYPIALQ